MDRVHAAPLDEDEEDQSIQLLSFCQKHRPKSTENMLSDKRVVQKEDEHAEYIPPINPSGCARTGIFLSTILPSFDENSSFRLIENIFSSYRVI